LRLRTGPGLNRRKSKARASAACPGSARAAATARSSGASSPRTCTSRRFRPRLRSRFRCSANAALGGVRGFDGGEGSCFGIPEIYPECRENARKYDTCSAVLITREFRPFSSHCCSSRHLAEPS
jgi:hypothetical protein